MPVFTAEFGLGPLPQELSPIILLPGAGMVLVGLGFIIYAWRRKLGLGYVALGALAWAIAVTLKVAWAVPLNRGIYGALTAALPAPFGSLVFDVYVGALTGVTEVALVYIFLLKSRFGQVPWERALAFGIGFGAIEAALLGLSSFAGGLAAFLSPDSIPAAVVAQYALANNVLYGVAPIVERAATILVHILASGLLFYAVATHQHRWFWAAFAYKTGIDSVASFAQLWGIDSLGHLWIIETIVILFGLVGWLGTRWLARNYPRVKPAVSPETESASVG